MHRNNKGQFVSDKVDFTQRPIRVKFENGEWNVPVKTFVAYTATPNIGKISKQIKRRLWVRDLIIASILGTILGKLLIILFK